MILEKFASPVEIATDRFTLRPVRKSDAGLFALYAGDKRVAEATRSIPHPLPPGAAEAFVNRAMQRGGDEDVWVMDGAASDLASNEDVKEFYLGVGGGERKSFKDVKSYKRRKRWLA